jgi:hypothetical protein
VSDELRIAQLDVLFQVKLFLRLDNIVSGMDGTSEEVVEGERRTE